MLVSLCYPRLSLVPDTAVVLPLDPPPSIAASESAQRSAPAKNKEKIDLIFDSAQGM